MNTGLTEMIFLKKKPSTPNYFNIDVENKKLLRTAGLIFLYEEKQKISIQIFPRLAIPPLSWE